MKVGVAAMGETLEAQVSDRFARCPFFLIVDSDNMTCEAVSNPAQEMPGGAGPAAVQELANHGVEVVVAGQFGPKAEQALQAAGIRYVQATGECQAAVATLES